MKKALFFLLALTSLIIEAQEYKYHAIMAEGYTVKLEGTIKITDSLMVISVTDKNGIQISDYDIINSRNNITYVTDGIATHTYTIQNQTGKKKGKKYNQILYFTMEAPDSKRLILYYLTEED